MNILDIHSHHEGKQAVMSLSAADLAKKYSSPQDIVLTPGQLYSVGIHPWDTAADIPDAAWHFLEILSVNPQVMAIGECGIDTLKGGPMFRQLSVFKRQLELAEKRHLPMVIHDVKAHDVLLGLHKQYRPSVKWAIHGFRYKPSVAAMFTSRGIYLSMGEKFNAGTLSDIPRELLLAETDESPLPIIDIIAALSHSADTTLLPAIADNTARFLNL